MQIDPNVLRACRITQGHTQTQQAHRAQVTYSYYIKLESGARNNPSRAVVERLAEAAGCYLVDLIADWPPPAWTQGQDQERARRILEGADL